MTVDSFYYPEYYTTDDEIVYHFNHESIGAEAIEVWLVLDDGTRIPLVQENA